MTGPQQEQEAPPATGAEQLAIEVRRVQEALGEDVVGAVWHSVLCLFVHECASLMSKAKPRSPMSVELGSAYSGKSSDTGSVYRPGQVRRLRQVLSWCSNLVTSWSPA